ncbi:hypothetical protein DTO271G3_8062 [Paecilomyces variotii]|nr:hypothetical protein DTO271G3_8062 [Paecilomyces variotii]
MSLALSHQPNLQQKRVSRRLNWTNEEHQSHRAPLPREAGYLNRESSIRPAKLELIKLISACQCSLRSAGHFEALTNYTPQTPNLQEWTIRLIVIMRSRDWFLLLTARLKNLTKK